MYRLILAVVMIAAAVTAHAAKPNSEKPKALDLDQPFLAQMDSIEKALNDGETYAEISQEDRSQVRQALAQIATALSKSGGDTLNKVEQTKLLNEQNLINQILGQAAADSRLICRREATIGSLRTTTQCKTVAERRREAQDAQDAMRRNPTGTYNKGG
ncbi:MULTISPECIES: hypothetical protein [unclassified Pseudoxanthomonas]|jgi:hypothetical protein|uniref:hypothetical protein n=1 Tax=unclassified Pseudoxanthomonas TaxID=2645906 RepID=UPI00307728FA